MTHSNPNWQPKDDDSDGRSDPVKLVKWRGVKKPNGLRGFATVELATPFGTMIFLDLPVMVDYFPMFIEVDGVVLTQDDPGYAWRLVLGFSLIAFNACGV